MSVTPGISNVIAKPPLQLGGVIRQSGRSLYKGLLGRSFSNVGAEKVIELKLGPIALAIAAATALIYKQGSESNKPGGGDKGFWKRVLAESGLGYFIVDNTKGIFPLWGLGISAFRAGQKNNLLEKAQAMVETATVMTLGYLGIHLGASFSEAANELEEREMFKNLNSEPMEKWIQRLEKEADPQAKALGGALRSLKIKLGEQNQWVKKGARQDWKAMRPLRKEVAGLKSEVYEGLTKLDEALVHPRGLPVQKFFRPFQEALLSSQEAYIKLVRSLNPIFGYMITGLLIGAPVAAFLNKILAARKPEWRQMHTRDLFGATALPPMTNTAHPTNQFSFPNVSLPGQGGNAGGGGGH